MSATLPTTAWEQAVFVALFIVFVSFLLGWFSRQQKQWQDFISKRDSDWQAWMDRAEVRAAASFLGVTNALLRIGEKLDEHDRKVDSRIAAIRENSAAQPRKSVPRKPID